MTNKTKTLWEAELGADSTLRVSWISYPVVVLILPKIGGRQSVMASHESIPSAVGFAVNTVWMQRKYIDASKDEEHLYLVHFPDSVTS
eukprot:795123-Amphidinium_carterae.2